VGIPEFRELLRRHPNGVAEFEKAFAAKFGCAEAVAFPYGRVAQRIYLESLGLPPMSRVAMPAYTCSVVAHAVTLSGMRPQFIDIDLRDYNMDLNVLAEQVDESVRVVIATHTFGYPQDLDALEALVHSTEERFGHKIYLVNDLAHAFGANWKGRPIATSGDTAVFGLNISKMITSIFGGMLLFRDRGQGELVRRRRDQLLERPPVSRSIRAGVYLTASVTAHAEWVFGLTDMLQRRTGLLDPWTRAYHLDDQVAFPPDARWQMPPVAAAVGTRQLTRYDKIIANRRTNAETYDELLDLDLDWVKPPLVSGATYSHYTVRVPDRELARMQWARRGFQLGELIQYSIPDMVGYRSAQEREFPRSALASRTTVNFPVTVDPQRLRRLLEAG